MKIEVINSQVYRGNPYQGLLYSAIGARYQLAAGSLDKAIKQVQATGCSIYHIQWEDANFAKCRTVAQAIKIRQGYVKKLRHYIELGGKVVWTLHNIKPHEWRFVETFLTLRKALAALSHRILVHNESTRSVLQEQTGLTDLSKVIVLPHPAYSGVYEPMEQTLAQARQLPVNQRTLLYFGLVRAYKGIPQLVRRLPPEFMTQHQLRLHICGEPVRADSFLDDLLAEIQCRPEISYCLESIPAEQVAGLLRSNAGLIIPYHKVLTSGVAMLSLTLGVPTVAPNTAAMRELYPDSAHHLLFNPRSAKDLRRAVLALVEMSAEVRKGVGQDYLRQAQLYHPQIVSKALGKIYDDLLGLVGDSREQDVTPQLLLSGDSLDGASFLSGGQRFKSSDDLTAQYRVPLLLQIISEHKPMAPRISQATAAALSNQQLALELVKATLLGSVRTEIPSELILNDVKKANNLTVERARLDSAYAVRLYNNILSRLETPPG